MSDQRYGSDVIADLIRGFDFKYIALNPGASYRGLHDSLVNRNGNDPPMLLCQHEKIAVQIAHGYAKASGRPMIAIVHDVVGLLHAAMAIYYAYLDRAPVFVIGATGPMDEAKRRPWIDWTHTANVQGDAVRNYIKWDYQPGGIDGVVDSFARAYSIMMTEPQGPVYMCYDAWLQEAELERPIAIPSLGATVPTPLAPRESDLVGAADDILAAEWPVLLPEYAGRSPDGFDQLVALAETLAAPVVDIDKRLNFPSHHELNLTFDPEVFRRADTIVALDARNWEQATHAGDGVARTTAALYPERCRWIDIGFSSVEISRWATDYQRFPFVHRRILADTALAIPWLTEICRTRIASDDSLRERIERRRRLVVERHRTVRKQWQEAARRDWDAAPMTVPRLVAEVWEAIRDEDWVLTGNTLENWARKLWNFDRGYRHPGAYLGTGTQIGMAIGVALAHRDQGRLVVDLQPDGDLMFDAGALWVAARYRIPLLVVMHNNRAYANDWNHQISIARVRGTPRERASIGQDIVDPPPDFAGLARAMGWYSEGPIDRPDAVAPALRRAIERVKGGQPALVDTITRSPG